MAETWHHILAHPDATFPPRTLARAIAPLVHRTVIDETQRLRYSGGWIWRDEPEVEIVERIASACEELGIPIARSETDAPIPPSPVEPVASAHVADERLFLTTPFRSLEVPVEECLACALGMTGTPRGKLDEKQEQVQRQVETMLIGLSHPHVRSAILGTGLTRPRPQVYLALAGLSPLFAIERTTRGPRQEEGSAGAIGLDGWLAFVDQLLAVLPDDRILPGIREFWEGGPIDPLLWDPPEHREPRLAWLRHWLDLHGDLASTRD